MTVLKQLYLDLEGNRLPPPKTRSYKAIVKQSATRTARPRLSIMSPREKMAAKALAYVLTMRGEDVPLGGANWNAVKMADFAIAPDDSLRVRSICLGRGWKQDARHALSHEPGEIVPIPHWDFVPTIVDESETRTCVEHAYARLMA